MTRVVPQARIMSVRGYADDGPATSLTLTLGAPHIVRSITLHFLRAKRVIGEPRFKQNALGLTKEAVGSAGRLCDHAT
jgi:hypothetical protein